jgi:hypothetical protein
MKQDSPSSPPSAPPSLWSSQLALLGLEDDAAVTSAPETEAEAARQRTLALPPLRLQARAQRTERPRASASVRGGQRLGARRRGWRLGTATLLAAAAVALLVWARPLFRPDETDLGGSTGLRTKGSGQVWLWWERDGSAFPWTEGDAPLESGDRVRAEVLAPEDGVAYWAVVDGQGRPLLEPAQVWQSALTVRAGVRAAFPGSFRLVGAPEGETLVVFICAGGGLEQAVLDAVLARGGTPLPDDQWPAQCGHQRFRLR